MADKLGLGPEIRELKIGSSFFNNKTAFHTLRYDFKPASVVSGSKHATIEIGTNQQVTVTHLESSGAPQTIFKGSRRPYQKECVLIIDKNTGEVTIEKLDTNIQLKKTRPEGSRPGGYSVGSSSVNSNVSSGGGGRPPTPVEKKQSPPGGVATAATVAGSSSSSSGRSKGPCQPPPPQARHSPRQHPSPQYNHRSSPLIVHKSPPQVSTLSLSPSPAASLPMIDDCNDSSSNSFDIGNPLTFSDLRDSPEFSTFQDEDGLSAQVGVLSDSSSDSSSDSNSSDSERETNSTSTSHPPQQQQHYKVNGHVNGKSSSSTHPIQSHFLNEDLQLSESGSDSD